jgi:hypothetical protein
MKAGRLGVVVLINNERTWAMVKFADQGPDASLESGNASLKGRAAK